MDDLLEQPVTTLAQLVQTGQVTSKALTTAFIDRIEAVNPQLNAVITSNFEPALKQAERADLALKSGETPGRLFGVPMTIKDSLDTFDTVTTWGTEGRREFRPGRDATCVSRLRNEGAILLGKTNTPEFTLSFKTDNALFGRTSNPWDLERTPGGSSGGAAAAIAARLSPFDIGTDTGGSIRLPCHFSGVAGIKPTTGRVPCTGNALPTSGLLAPLSQPGPMAKTVAELSFLLPIIAGPDLVDPHAVPASWSDPAEVDVSSLRVGFHTDNGISTPDAAIQQAVQTAADCLRDQGCQVAEDRPTGIEMTAFIYGRLFSADNGDMVEMLLEDCRTRQPSAGVARILAERAPDGGSAAEFAQVISLWHNYQSSMLSYFNQHDVLICPVNARTALPHDEPENPTDYTYTMAFNLTGWPGVVIRAGTDAAGLPVGVQIVTRPFTEHLALAVAAALEAEFGEYDAPPL